MKRAEPRAVQRFHQVVNEDVIVLHREVSEFPHHHIVFHADHSNTDHTQCLSLCSVPLPTSFLSHEPLQRSKLAKVLG